MSSTCDQPLNLLVLLTRKNLASTRSRPARSSHAADLRVITSSWKFVCVNALDLIFSKAVLKLSKKTTVSLNILIVLSTTSPCNCKPFSQPCFTGVDVGFTDF